MCQTSVKELGFLCGLPPVTIGRASVILLNPHTLAYVTHEDICRCFAGEQSPDWGRWEWGWAELQCCAVSSEPKKRSVS